MNILAMLHSQRIRLLANQNEVKRAGSTPEFPLYLSTCTSRITTPIKMLAHGYRYSINHHCTKTLHIKMKVRYQSIYANTKNGSRVRSRASRSGLVSNTEKVYRTIEHNSTQPSWGALHKNLDERDSSQKLLFSTTGQPMVLAITDSFRP